MNQDSSFPPMLPPSTELGALLFAVLPCLQEDYRPLASFVYHLTELKKIRTFPSMPPLSGLSGMEAFISDKDTMMRSLSFYGKLFHMPLLSTIASLFQAFQFYHAYKDILPGLFSVLQTGNGDASPPGNMSGLFSGAGSPGGNGLAELLTAFGGLSPDLLASMLSGFTGTSPAKETAPKTPEADQTKEPASDKVSTKSPLPDAEPVTAPSDILQSDSVPDDSPLSGAASVDSLQCDNTRSANPDDAGSDTLFDNLSAFLTPEQKKIYEELMHNES